MPSSCFPFLDSFRQRKRGEKQKGGNGGRRNCGYKEKEGGREAPPPPPPLPPPPPPHPTQHESNIKASFPPFPTWPGWLLRFIGCLPEKELVLARMLLKGKSVNTESLHRCSMFYKYLAFHVQPNSFFIVSSQSHVFALPPLGNGRIFFWLLRYDSK